MIISLIPIVSIKKIGLRAISQLFFRIILYLTGLFTINPQPTSIYDTFSEPPDIPEPKGGDLIICNLASYLNLFWLQKEYSPIFVIPFDDENVYVFNVFQLFFRVLLSRPLKLRKNVPLSQVIEASKKIGFPIVIFPEQAVTNGSYIVNFAHFGKGVKTDGINFHIFGFVHFDSRISPNFTYGNGPLHFLQMLGRFPAGLKIKIALPQDIPKLDKNEITNFFIARCRIIMSQITGIPVLSCDGSSFDKFGSKQTNQKKKED